VAAPHEKLADSLGVLHALQAKGRRVFRSNELSRVHRERLVKGRYLQEACRGWLFITDPKAQPGDSTPWYASLWEFCATHCTARFGADWHLGAEQSLLLHAENSVVPPQLLVYAGKGGNNSLALPFGTSLFDYRERTPPPEKDIVLRDGLRVFSIEAALVKAPEAFYARSPVEAHTCLAAVPSPSALIERLLDGGNSTVAGRLAGAFRHIGRAEFADEIVAAMTAAGYKVHRADPFGAGRVFGVPAKAAPPIAIRLCTLWAAMRETVVSGFPKAPGRPADPASYLHAVDDIYVDDAYHSLSIEGYRVTPELIGRVRSGSWDPDGDDGDRKSQDALAARGYWQAFNRVKRSVADVLGGGAAAEVAARDMPAWYREMFQPCVMAGTLRAGALAGYRQQPVYLRTSRFVPPRSEVVPDAMACLFDLLKAEPEPSVQAVLGHWLLGYIHPYPDGNGRTARFLMNVMLAGGGYPWTIIRNDNRADYLAALDKASIDGDIGHFTRFVADRVAWSMENAPIPPPPAANAGRTG
jgi:hypothetical protein